MEIAISLIAVFTFGIFYNHLKYVKWRMNLQDNKNGYARVLLKRIEKIDDNLDAVNSKLTRIAYPNDKD